MNNIRAKTSNNLPQPQSPRYESPELPWETGALIGHCATFVGQFCHVLAHLAAIVAQDGDETRSYSTIKETQQFECIAFGTSQLVMRDHVERPNLSLSQGRRSLATPLGGTPRSIQRQTFLFRPLLHDV